MKHLGDITKISGHDEPVVDCIVGGSPCQDLSLAGKRAGLAGARSGLYMEQIRIIKEMRESDALRGNTDVDIRPRYMVWENVPGAFSTNGGKDFAAVLEEAVRVAEPEAPPIPVPEKGWPTSGCVMGDKWSVAWRVLDAQFWGTSNKPLPQRRRRIALVADFGGQSAPEILFVRESVSGNIKPGEPKRKETAGEAGDGVGADDQEGTGFDGYNGDLSGDVSATLGVNCGVSTGRNGVIDARQLDAVGIVNAIGGNAENYQLSNTLPTLTNGNAPGFMNAIAVALEPGITQREGSHIYEGVSGTLRANAGDKQMAVAYADMVLDDQGGSQIAVREDGKCPTRMGTGGGNVPMVMETVPYGISSFDSNAMKSSNPHSGIYVADTSRTIDCNGGNPACNQGGIAIVEKIVLDDQGGQRINVRTDGKIPTLRAEMHGNVPCVMKAFGDYEIGGAASTLKARDYKSATDLVIASGVDCRNMNETPESYPTLQAKSNGGQSLNYSGAVRCHHIVRRLTPMECERLQGFPDGWTDIGEWVDTKGKKHKEADSPRYKALGNSIAIPPWKWVLKRLCACYERDATMASLFDGIGGFPYIWEQLNGKGSCLWASEIEEFPMAVTKVRFGG